MNSWRAVVAFVSRLRDLCGRRRLAREAEQEIEMHLDLLAAQYVPAGKTPAATRRLVPRGRVGAGWRTGPLPSRIFARRPTD